MCIKLFIWFGWFFTQNLLSIFMLKITIFTLIFNHSLKDTTTVNATVEFFESTEFPWNSPEFNPLDCYVWNEFKQKVYKSLQLLQQWIENVWPLVSQGNIQSAVDQLQETSSSYNPIKLVPIQLWIPIKKCNVIIKNVFLTLKCKHFCL